MAVTPDDIAVELGRPTPVQEPTRTQWETWIDRTYRAIERRAENLGIDYGSLDPQLVDDVVILAVSAHAERPTSETQVTVSADDGSVSRQYRSSQGRVVILDEWWVDLGLTAASDVYSLRLTGEPDVSPNPGAWA